MKKYFVYISLLLISCNLIKNTSIKEVKCLTIINGKKIYVFNDFPLNELNFSDCDIQYDFIDGYSSRYGKTIDGLKYGRFITGVEKYDSVNNKFFFKKIFKEEHFKKGLRDSIFRQFDLNGKVIYETTFNMGTGLWKEFHGNGNLYFEAYTKDGYFTDTLKLYNAKGQLMEKLLYKKDSLLFKENMIIDDFPTDNK